MTITVATFYHFFDFYDFAERRLPLLKEMKRRGITGTVLVTPEGINGTVAGNREAIDALSRYLSKQVIGAPLTHKESVCDAQPFGRAKVKLKKETISLGEKVVMDNVGDYISPQNWNALIADPDTIVIDTRNAYEVHLGTFERALDPGTRNFKELPNWSRKALAQAKQRRIATFCTGGIRCEKYTAWLRQEGFENVYHLQGGILKYLEEVPAQESRWQGECFVFDERVAVGHDLAPSQTATQCDACGHTLTPRDREHPLYQAGSRCSFCDESGSCKKSRIKRNAGSNRAGLAADDCLI